MGPIPTRSQSFFFVCPCLCHAEYFYLHIELGVWSSYKLARLKSNTSVATLKICNRILTLFSMNEVKMQLRLTCRATRVAL